MRHPNLPTGVGLLLLVLATAVGWSIALPEAVSAGTYEVTSCSATPTGVALLGADDAWRFETDDAPHLEDLARCPVTLAASIGPATADGLVVWTRLNSGGARKHGYGAWRFEAPPGTSIVRLGLAREIGKQLDEFELYTRVDGVALGNADCKRGPDVPWCVLGGPGSPMTWWSVDTPASSVAFGMTCVNVMNQCTTGSSRHEAWAAIYQAKVTVQDLRPPDVVGGSGTLFSGGWLRGTVTAVVDAAQDETGIKEAQVRLGAVRPRSVPLTCDFTRARPCTDLTSPVSVSIDTTTVPDGTHVAEVGATDAASNFAAARSATIRVDNTAPAGPVPLSATSMVQTTPDGEVAWAVPGGQAAPVVAAHWSVCGPATCTTGRSATTGARGSLPVRLDALGTYVVRVWLEDEAGNHAPASATTWVLDRSAPAAPAPPPTAPPPAPKPRAAPALADPRLRLSGAPTVSADGRTLTVRGVLAAAATGRVRVLVRTRARGRRLTVASSAPIRRRRFSVRVRMPAARWSRATVSVRYPGNETLRAGSVTRALRRPGG